MGCKGWQRSSSSMGSPCPRRRQSEQEAKVQVRFHHKSRNRLLLTGSIFSANLRKQRKVLHLTFLAGTMLPSKPSTRTRWFSLVFTSSTKTSSRLPRSSGSHLPKSRSTTTSAEKWAKPTPDSRRCASYSKRSSPCRYKATPNSIVRLMYF